jgi:hypothetical protein
LDCQLKDAVNPNWFISCLETSNVWEKTTHSWAYSLCGCRLDQLTLGQSFIKKSITENMDKIISAFTDHDKREEGHGTIELKLNNPLPHLSEAQLWHSHAFFFFLLDVITPSLIRIGADVFSQTSGQPLPGGNS